MKLAVGERNVATNLGIISGCVEEYYFSGFAFDQITAVDMSFSTSLQNFIQIGPPSAEKNDVMSIFKMADLGHLGF